MAKITYSATATQRDQEWHATILMEVNEKIKSRATFRRAFFSEKEAKEYAQEMLGCGYKPEIK